MGNNIYNSLGDFYDAHQMETFDYAFGQFKAQLRECVRDEWVSEMARLREENAKYADIKARWAEIEAERQQEREEVERVKREAKSYARYARMTELFADVCSAVYHVEVEYRSRPWCGKCDSKRRVHYKNPVTGKDCTEVCPDCGKDYMVYVPQELQAYEAKMNNFYAESNSLTVWYRKAKDEDGYLYTVEEFADEKPFKEINRYTVIFKSLERCQAYCDWRNTHKRNQEGDDE